MRECRLTESGTNTVTRSITEYEQISPSLTQELMGWELFKPALRSEHVRVLPYRLHTLDGNDGNNDDLRRYEVGVELELWKAGISYLSGIDGDLRDVAAIYCFNAWFTNGDRVRSLRDSFHVWQSGIHS